MARSASPRSCATRGLGRGSPTARDRSPSRRSRHRSPPPGAACASRSATTARRGRRPGPSTRPARPGRGRRSSRSAVAPRAPRASTSSSRRSSATRATATRSATRRHSSRRRQSAPSSAASRSTRGPIRAPAGRRDRRRCQRIGRVDRRGSGRLPADPRRRHRRGPNGRPGAGPQARGGNLDPGRLAQPRDVPPRSPAVHGREDRPGPDPDRAAGTRRTGRRGRARRSRAPESSACGPRRSCRRTSAGSSTRR